MSTMTMLRSILVGVDGTSHSHSAIEFGIIWAKRRGACLIGIDVVDDIDPTAHLQEVSSAADAEYHRQRVEAARARAKKSLDDFERRCAQAGITSIGRSETGNVSDRILEESQKADLLILGAETHFYSEWAKDRTASNVLHSAARPIVVVPRTLPRNESVLVAYDGSSAASKALFAFVALGLGESNSIHVLTISSDSKSVGTRNVAREFLERHNLDVHCHHVSSHDDPATVLLDHATKLDAGMLVAGSYGHSRVREWIFGSTTKQLVEHSTIPLFMFH